MFLLSSSVTGDIPNWFAVTMGIGTVFVGLIAIIIICIITGALCGASKKNKSAAGESSATGKKTDDKELIAAVCAVCAEDMGTDVNGLRVVSFKKL